MKLDWPARSASSCRAADSSMKMARRRACLVSLPTIAAPLPRKRAPDRDPIKAASSSPSSFVSINSERGNTGMSPSRMAPKVVHYADSASHSRENGSSKGMCACDSSHVRTSAVKATMDMYFEGRLRGARNFVAVQPAMAEDAASCHDVFAALAQLFH